MTNVVVNFILKKMKPITPEEVIKKQEKMVCDYVIKIFNDMIASSWDGVHACVKKDNVREALTKRGYNFDAMMKQGGLKIEPLYSEKWHVEYDGEGWTFSVLKEKSL